MQKDKIPPVLSINGVLKFKTSDHDSHHVMKCGSTRGKWENMFFVLDSFNFE